MNHAIPLNQALSIFEDELPEIRKACLSNAVALSELYVPAKELDVDEPITPEAIELHLNHLRIEEQVKPILKTVRRIDSYRLYKNNPNPSAGVTDEDIQRAREIEAEWFIQEANLSTRRPFKGVCHFHADRDPSMQLMKSKTTGKYYLKCYVCNEPWDSIKYIMERDNMDFIPAVKYIIG